MAELTADYRAESKAMRDRYGETAEVPRTPIGATAGMLKGQPITVRIADLAKQVAETAHRLQAAREQHHEASVHRSKCEAMFAEDAERLLQAIHEHREGTPENVPCQP